jgi:hypothetical protein
LVWAYWAFDESTEFVEVVFVEKGKVRAGKAARQ